MTDLISLPNTGFAPTNASIAACLYEQAAWIESRIDPIRTVVIIIETADGTLDRQVIGHPCDLARTVGLLTIGTIQASVGERA